MGSSSRLLGFIENISSRFTCSEEKSLEGGNQWQFPKLLYSTHPSKENIPSNSSWDPCQVTVFYGKDKLNGEFFADSTHSMGTCERHFPKTAFIDLSFKGTHSKRFQMGFFSRLVTLMETISSSLNRSEE